MMSYKCFYICHDGRKDGIGWQGKSRVAKLELVFVTNWVLVKLVGQIKGL
jgi:hypothetical protein